MTTWLSVPARTSSVALVSTLALLAGVTGASSRLTSASAPSSAPDSATTRRQGPEGAPRPAAGPAPADGWTVSGVAASTAAGGLDGRVVASARWSFPLSPRPVVVAAFSAPAGPYAAGHRGVDLAAAAAEVVRSPTVGTVTFAGEVVGRRVLVITHPGGLRSTLEPVTSSVPVGTVVGRGGAVGTVGTVDTTPGHCAPASCVHWGVLRGTTYLDPLQLVRTPRVVLLPLGP